MAPKTGFGNLPFRSNDIREIANSYEWCLMPWGSDYTSMMMALVSSDDHVIRQVKEILLETQCADLIVSHYTAAEVATHQFTGRLQSRHG